MIKPFFARQQLSNRFSPQMKNRNGCRFTAEVLNACPSVKFVIGLQCAISLNNSVFTSLLLRRASAAAFGVVSCRPGWYGERD